LTVKATLSIILEETQFKNLTPTLFIFLLIVSADPLDSRYISLKTSLKFPQAGESVFAKTDIPGR
jgi:hypothetical protein